MKTTKNDITGDLIKTKPSSQAYSDNWDNIFRRKMEAIIYGKDNCPYCEMALKLCQQKGVKTMYKKLDRDFDRLEMAKEFPNARTFPQIILDGEKIGGYTELEKTWT
jgi:glutaredoxin 3